VVVDVVLEARGVRKTFGGVKALDDVDFTLRRGEIHGLVGQNGAGKSTLVKILDGVHRPDAGEIRLQGSPVVLSSPSAAREAGIAMVFQEFSLVPTLSVADNIHLNHEPRFGRAFIDDREAARRTSALLGRLGVQLDPRAKVGGLTVGSQQLVEIAKAMANEPAILVLDEPTASLSQAEIELLFGVVRALRESGVSVIYISHHLGEVLSICDTITVLRDGRVRSHGPTRELTLAALVTAMTGRSPGDLAVSATVSRSIDRTVGPVLTLSRWTLGARLVEIELALWPGEVLGVAGLLGSGRTSLLRSVVGLEPEVRGRLSLAGRAVRFSSPGDALAAGVAYVPEDRRREGIVAGQSVQANLLMGVWDRLTRHFLLDEDRARRTGQELVGRLDIRTSGLAQLIEQLSGGNQQKVVVGRSLAGGPRVLLLDDPTAGIDIASRRELLGHVRRFADEGGSVLLVSSELEELGAIADRVAITARGSLVGTLDPAAGDALTEASLLAAIQMQAPGVG
jgi:ribose transport system ATP-binding protein